MKFKDLIILNVINLVVLILELLPWSTSAIFVYLNESGEKVTSKVFYSHYDPILFGNGNYFPIITLFMTIALTSLLLLNLAKENFVKLNSIKIVVFVAFFTSLLTTLLFQFKTITAVGVVISILLLLEVIYIYYIEALNKKNIQS